MENVNENQVYSLQDWLDERKLQETLQQDITDMERYKGDFKLFTQYCEEKRKEVNGQSLLHYLHDSIKEERIKRNTFNRRYFAIKKFLERQGIVLKQDQVEIVHQLRKLYQTHEFAELNHVEGKHSVNSEELLQFIGDLSNIRDKAILYVQFYSGNRPSEMVLLQKKHFDLERRRLKVYLPKQRTFVDKVLPLVCIPVLKQYFSKYQMGNEDYFIGALNRYGNYQSRPITVRAYHKYLNNLIGLSAYNFRKTIVSHMHLKGADVQTIQKQTGHQNSYVLTKYYLEVSKDTVEKYL